MTGQKPPLILVVDDNQSAVFITCKILELQKYKTLSALDGEEALEKAADHDIDLILLDIMMPGMNGYEVCEKLKENPEKKDVPVIFITAKTDPESIAKGFKAGGVDYLTKPFKNLELQARVKTHLDLKFSRQKMYEELRERKKAESLLKKEREQLDIKVKERTKELEIANKELKKASKLKDEFLANMSHEFRTPLNTVLSLADALTEGTFGQLNEKQAKYINSIHESGKHLLSLVNDILDIAKIEAGKIDLEYTNISIHPFMNSCLRMVKQIAENKSIQIQTNINANIHGFYADERRMKQILVNLLSNAIKFTPAEKSIGIDVDKERDFIIFAVWDEGIGIKEGDIDQLFRPFTQIDSKLSRRYVGTGLGLALVNSLVNFHNGSIRVQSQLNVGSRFIVSIPVKDNK